MVLYHVGIPFLPGGFVGVDVFFVISGFLITSLLLREAERTGHVSLRRFYARRAKRLLPASALVLLVTAALTAWLLQASDRRAFGIDIASAAGYVVNWRLAFRAVDYLAEGSGTSPVLHFWSLAIEEQFYLIWPLLILAALAISRRVRWSPRRVTLAVLALVGIPSFVQSVVLTQHDASSAFFFTTSRMWELAVGAAVAIAAPRLTRLPRPAASALSGAGVIGIAAAAILLSEQTAWPGWIAAVPVAAAAAVIAGGIADSRGIAARVLGVKPLVWMGGLSYSLYLWHWPALIFATATLGEMRIRTALLVAMASMIPAYLTLRFVENPVRFSRRMSRGSALPLAVGAALTLLGVVAGLVVALTSPQTSSGSQVVIVEVPEGTSQSGAGAQALGDSPASSSAGVPQDNYPTILPAPAAAVGDLYPTGCQGDPKSTTLNPCPTGDLLSDVVIAAVGDSKMLQYYPALDIAGRALGVRFVFMTKTSCPSTDALTVSRGAAYDTCMTFNKAVDAELKRNPPSGVITAGIVYETAKTSPLSAQEGLEQRWARWEGEGIPVSVLLEYPVPDFEVYSCMQETPNYGDCLRL